MTSRSIVAIAGLALAGIVAHASATLIQPDEAPRRARRVQPAEPPTEPSDEVEHAPKRRAPQAAQNEPAPEARPNDAPPRRGMTRRREQDFPQGGPGIEPQDAPQAAPNAPDGQGRPRLRGEMRSRAREFARNHPDLAQRLRDMPPERRRELGRRLFERRMQQGFSGRELRGPRADRRGIEGFRGRPFPGQQFEGRQLRRGSRSIPEGQGRRPFLRGGDGSQGGPGFQGRIFEFRPEPQMGARGDGEPQVMILRRRGEARGNPDVQRVPPRDMQFRFRRGEGRAGEGPAVGPDAGRPDTGGPRSMRWFMVEPEGSPQRAPTRRSRI